MYTDTLDVREVRAAIDAKAWRTCFPAAIEATYEKHRRRYRARDVKSTVLPCIVVYNAFLILDYWLVPETFVIAAALHGLLVTPYMLWAASVFGREPGRTVRELVTISVPVLMVAQILGIYLLNSGPGADQYQYLAIMVLVYLGSVLRADTRYAVAASVIVAILYALALWIGTSPPAVAIVGLTMMVSAAYLTVTANRRVEQSARHSFLRGLQDRFDRRAALDMAKRDPLTGLANRRHLDETASMIWPDLARNERSAAVLVLDVDRFKLLNDTFGHDVGDACLKAVAKVFVRTVRREDLTVRYGGEEFVVLLLDVTQAQAAAVGERIRRAVEALGLAAGGDAPGGVVTISVGVSRAPTDRASLPDLIARADKALYRAKTNGRNQVALHEDATA